MSLVYHRTEGNGYFPLFFNDLFIVYGWNTKSNLVKGVDRLFKKGWLFFI